ncbi:hypothetical protein [Streptomyces atroolivaceus]
MIVRLAQEQDLTGLLGPAAQVEDWFGPMVEEPGPEGGSRQVYRRPVT